MPAKYQTIAPQRVEWTYSDVHNSPYPALAVLFEHCANFVPSCQINLMALDLGCFYVAFGCIRGQLAARQSRYPRQRVGVRVVTIVERDDLVASSFLQGVYYVRACQRSSVGGWMPNRKRNNRCSLHRR